MAHDAGEFEIGEGCGGSGEQFVLEGFGGDGQVYRTLSESYFLQPLSAPWPLHVDHMAYWSRASDELQATGIIRRLLHILEELLAELEQHCRRRPLLCGRVSMLDPMQCDAARRYCGYRHCRTERWWSIDYSHSKKAERWSKDPCACSRRAAQTGVQ